MTTRSSSRRRDDRDKRAIDAYIRRNGRVFLCCGAKVSYESAYVSRRKNRGKPALRVRHVECFREAAAAAMRQRRRKEASPT